MCGDEISNWTEFKLTDGSTTRRSLLYALATSVYHTGLETTNFFSAPFAKEFKKLPDELTEAFGLDLQEFITFTRK